MPIVLFPISVFFVLSYSWRGVSFFRDITLFLMTHFCCVFTTFIFSDNRQVFVFPFGYLYQRCTRPLQRLSCAIKIPYMYSRYLLFRLIFFSSFSRLLFLALGARRAVRWFVFRRYSIFISSPIPCQLYSVHPTTIFIAYSVFCGVSERYIRLSVWQK